MKPAKLTCPYAKYNRHMLINCSKTGEACANSRWCATKGWALLTDKADDCPARKEENNDDKREVKAAPKRRNKV